MTPWEFYPTWTKWKATRKANGTNLEPTAQRGCTTENEKQQCKVKHRSGPCSAAHDQCQAHRVAVRSFLQVPPCVSYANQCNLLPMLSLKFLSISIYKKGRKEFPQRSYQFSLIKFPPIFIYKMHEKFLFHRLNFSSLYLEHVVIEKAY